MYLDYVQFQGGIVNNTIETDPLSVHIIDSAAMLSPYLRSNIAAATYVPLTRTVNGKALSSNITLGLASSDFANQGTTTTVLHGNASGNPAFGSIVNADITNSTIDLTTKVTGVLPIANGGTSNGSLSVTAGTVYYGDGSKLIGLAPGTSNQILHGGTAPAWKDTTAVSGSVGWSTTGNAGTSYPTNFLGTTDNITLRLRTNNVQRMSVDSNGNVGISSFAAFNTAAYRELMVRNYDSASIVVSSIKNNGNAGFLFT
jgi:hypothetical protein